MLYGALWSIEEEELSKISPDSVTKVATPNLVEAAAPDLTTSATYLMENVIETTTNEREKTGPN